MPAGVATFVSHQPVSAPADIPLLASTAIRRTLTGPLQPARSLGSSNGALYLMCEEGALLALLAPGAARLPIALFCGSAAELHRLGASVAAPIQVGRGRVTLGAVVATAVRWWDPGVVVDLAANPVAAPPGGMRTPGELGLPTAPVEGLSAALHTGEAPALRAAAHRLAGLGPGLTPAGDDILIGVQSVLTCSGHPLSAVLPDAIRGRTTELSQALLRCAGDGAYLGEVGAVLRALGRGADLDRPWARLAAVGHTSGAALGVGMLIGVAAL